MEQTLIENACHGAAGFTADVLCFLDTAFGKSFLDLLQKGVGVGLGEGEVENSLNCERKADDEAEDDEGHEACTAFDELGLDGLGERNFFGSFLCKRSNFSLVGFCNLLGSFVSGGCGVLCGRDVGSEGHKGQCRQNHEKLFHN